MGVFSTMLQAGIAAYTAARRVFEDPSISHNQMLYLNQQAMYNLLWSYYNGSMFERIVGAANMWNWNIYAGGWQAYNWQARKAVQVRYGAALGNVLIEVVDDVEHGCVSADIIWPGFVVDLECDNAGNVKRYVL